MKHSIFLVILLLFSVAVVAQRPLNSYPTKVDGQYQSFGSYMASNDSFVFASSREVYGKVQVDTHLTFETYGRVYCYKIKPNGRLKFHQFIAPDSVYGSHGDVRALAATDSSFLYSCSDARYVSGIGQLPRNSIIEFRLRNDTWVQHQRIVKPSTAINSFGVDISVGENILVAPYLNDPFNANQQDSIYGAGSAYIFERLGNSWVQTQKITASRRYTRSWFGYKTSTANNRVFVSARFWQNYDANGQRFNDGKVFVFEKQGGKWVQTDSLSSPDYDLQMEFGSALLAKDSLLFVSATRSSLDSSRLTDSSWLGCVYVYQLQPTGRYQLIEKLHPETTQDFLFFGLNISYSNGNLIVGSPGRAVYTGKGKSVYSAGSAHRFKKINNQFKLIEELALPDSLRKNQDYFGWSLQIIDTTIIIAALNIDSIANGSIVFPKRGKLYATAFTSREYFDTVHLCYDETFSGWQFKKPRQIIFPYLTKDFEDSFVHFTILPEWNIIDTTINVCYEYTSPISGNTWKQSGFYTDTIHRLGACDSVFRITLNVLDQTRTLKRRACDSFITSSGKVYYSSGTYIDKYQNQLGCDSFIVWDLTINNSSTARIAVFDCYQYTMPSKKYTVYESGVYGDTIKTKHGCDSILTVVVTIPPRRPDTTHIKGCGAYYVPSGKFQMTKSGFYYDTLRTHYGCDSLVLIDFEQEQTSSLFTLNACLEAFSPSGKYFYTQSGRYYDTMLNKAGCDSFMTIDLVLFDTFITNVETAFCDSFISPLGRVYKSNAEFTEILESQTKCDSTVHYSITSNAVSASILERTGYLESNVLADEYHWLECGSNKGKVLATDAKFVPSFSSSFKLAVKKNNCWDTTQCLPFYTAGVYPNPTTGQILLSFGAQVENCQVIIIDPLGREINFLQLGNMERQWIDLPQQSGMCVLHITGNNIEPLLEKVLVIRK